MDGYLALVIITAIVVVGISACSIADSLKPKPQRPNLNRFEVMESELERLHSSLDEVREIHEPKVLEEIARINQALTEAKDEDQKS